MNASQDHAAIILLLLALLGTVLLIGALLTIVVRRYLRARRAARAGRRTSAEFRGDRLFQSSVFQCPNRWVAIKSANLQAVEGAVGLDNPAPRFSGGRVARGRDPKVFGLPP